MTIYFFIFLGVLARFVVPILRFRLFDNFDLREDFKLKFILSSAVTLTIEIITIEFQLIGDFTFLPASLAALVAFVLGYGGNSIANGVLNWYRDVSYWNKHSR